jgi:hypothetical protein
MAILDQYGNPAPSQPFIREDGVKQRENAHANSNEAAGHSDNNNPQAQSQAPVLENRGKNPRGQREPEKHKRDWFDITNLIVQIALCVATVGAFWAAARYASIASEQRRL